MTIKVSKVSTFSLNQSTTNNALGIQGRMAELQRQIATGVKATNFEGYNVDSLKIQRYRANLTELESYHFDIDMAETNIEQMNSALEQVAEQIQHVIGEATIRPQEGTQPDPAALNALAKNVREIAIDVMNSRVGDRYLFSGADTATRPYPGDAGLVQRVQQEMSDWLDQTNTATSFINNVKGLTDSQLGYSLTVQNAGSVYVRADDKYEVDYTVKANGDGFTELLQGLTIFSELKVPDPATDLATLDQYYEVLNAATDLLISGVNNIRVEETKLSNSYQAIGNKKQDLIAERAALLHTLESTEGIDIAEAITVFQSLQIQLEMSYQTTSIISQLSLSRFI